MREKYRVDNPYLFLPSADLREHPETSSIFRMGSARLLWEEAEQLHTQYTASLDENKSSTPPSDKDLLTDCIEKYASAIFLFDKVINLIATEQPKQDAIISLVHAQAKRFGKKEAKPDKNFFLLHCISGLVWLQNLRQGLEGATMGRKCAGLSVREKATFIYMEGRVNFAQLARAFETQVKSSKSNKEFVEHGKRVESHYKEALKVDPTLTCVYHALYALYVPQEEHIKTRDIVAEYLTQVKCEDDPAMHEMCILHCNLKLAELETRRGVKFNKFHEKMKKLYLEKVSEYWNRAGQLRQKHFWGNLPEETEKFYENLKPNFPKA